MTNAKELARKFYEHEIDARRQKYAQYEDEANQILERMSVIENEIAEFRALMAVTVGNGKVTNVEAIKELKAPPLSRMVTPNPAKFAPNKPVRKRNPPRQYKDMRNVAYRLKRFTAKEFAEAVGFPDSTQAHPWLNRLMERGVIRRVGKKFSATAYYELIKPGGYTP